jgi:DNA-binding MarR family transcriptional regulator
MSSRKRKLFLELLAEIRASQAATDRFDQAVADLMGLNRTDLRVLDLIDREERVSAGRIAEATGLTTGAVTTVIDRLEKAGYAHRVRDEHDRRRVLVELDAHARERGRELFREHMELSERLYHRYTEEQIELLVEFIREGRELNERQAARLEAGQADQRRSAR